MKLKSLIIALAGLIIVLAAISAAYYWRQPAASPTPAAPIEHTYNNQAYGISFVYPDELLLHESDAGTAGHTRHTITLTPKDAGTGATAVTIDIVENDVAKMSLASYFAGDPHHAETSGTFATSSPKSIVPAIIYHWSGTTTGETTAFEHMGAIIAVSESYPSASAGGILADSVVTAYRNLLASFTLAN